MWRVELRGAGFASIWLASASLVTTLTVMLRGLLVLFILVPLLELYLLTLIAAATSFWWAVALTVVTGVVGGSLAKREGLKVWRRWQSALNRMQVPEEGVVGGLLVLVGGVLLITPGVLTDVVGFLLLIPHTRHIVARMVRARVDQRFQISQGPVVFGGPLGDDFRAPQQRVDTIDTSGSPIETNGTPLDEHR